MTTAQAPLTLLQARKFIAEVAFGALTKDSTSLPKEGEVPGGIGLEPEYFVVSLEHIGTPLGRPKLFADEEFEGGPKSVLGQLDAAAMDPDLGFFQRSEGPVPAYDLKCGGKLTFEPGGQVEHSTKVHATAAAAMEDLEFVRAGLERIFKRENQALVTLGVDPWHDVLDVPQQLRGPRYRAQAEFYEQRGPAGRTMMRHTTSLQINLDIGPGAVGAERWALTNMISPLITSCFTTSPCETAKDCAGGRAASSVRAKVWQTLDPTRTGFPASLVEADGSTAPEHYADLVLDADVMMFRRPDQPEGMATGTMGLSFRNWIESGHPTFGAATKDDLDYHLTTVFPEVRARGFLELRAADGLPADLVAPFVVLVSGLIYDPVARRAAIELLEGPSHRMPELWDTAAEKGLEDDELAGLAGWVWPLALEGARRMPADYFRPADITAAEEFLDRYVLDRKSPSLELSQLIGAAPERALDWNC
ncbi:MAG: glutamate-cysteine ligase family protein [Planctomycetota bacterium]|nr:glutamate-cysteine ligase family protein [Planctomycetota bacterium]MDG2142561.1 glutamate-cysteine ligase family protein [Planctomycetota bacterium]